jgi:hypothetical protein
MEQHIQLWNYLLEHDDLDLVDTVILSKIIALNKTKLKCFITNDSLAKIVKLKDGKRISRRLSSLEKRGYIKTHYHDSKRYLTPIVSKDNLPCLVRQPPLSHETTPLVSEDTPPLSRETTNNINYNINNKITNKTNYNISKNSENSYIEQINNSETEFAQNTIINYCKRIVDNDIPKDNKDYKEYLKCKNTLELINSK